MKPYRTSQAPSDLNRPAPKSGKDTNKEILAAFEKAVSRRQK
ncbi:hypothetical protein AB0G06_43375 [Nonomuraea dietziae]